MLFIVYEKEQFGWTWALGGWDDGKLRSVDLTYYKTKKELFAALDSFDTYKSCERRKKKKEPTSLQ